MIGNAAYEHAGVLTKPTNDAEDIATKLAGCGFTVSQAIDCSVLEMGRALKRFKKAWRRSAAARGLAPVHAPKGTLIAFATSPGQVASDGKGRNGA